MAIPLKIIYIALILLSLGIAVLLIYQGQPLPLLDRVITLPLLEKSPGNVLNQTAHMLEQTTTASYRIDLQQTLPFAGETLQMNTTLTHHGQLFPLWRGVSSIVFEFDAQNVRFRSSAEIRATDESIYFGFREFPAIPFLDRRSLDEVWYEFPNQWTAHTANNAPVRITDYISSVQREADVKINNMTMYQLNALADVQRFFRAWGISFATPSSIVPITLFINKDDFRLYRVEITEESSPMSITISDYEQQVSVIEPTNQRPFDTIWSDIFIKTNILDLPLFASLLGFDISQDTTDNDQDGLLLLWERLFGTDPDKIDTDGDGFSDSEELKNGYSPVGMGRLLPFSSSPVGAP